MITNWDNPTHDAAGNMTAIPNPLEPQATGLRYIARYDAWNRLARLDKERIGGPGVDRVAFRYDGLHRRVLRANPGLGPLGGGTDSTHFYYNERWQCLEERSAETSPATKQFVWGPTYIDELICRDRGQERLFALQDALYSVTALLDSEGDVVERYHYDAYGKSTVLEPDFSIDPDGKSDFDNEHLYTGRRTDPGTGLQLNRKRYYHAGLGRWLSRDPMEYLGSPYNLYEYVRSSPVLLQDPSGLMPPCMHPCGYDAPFCQACSTAVAGGVAATIDAGYGGIHRLNPHDGGNAFQHCLAACRIKRICGQKCASCHWDNREDNRKNNPHDAMDYANNQHGYAAPPNQGCWEYCGAMWKAGNLECLSTELKPIKCPGW